MSKEIARLRDTEVPVNLTEYYGRISVYLGSTAFTLLEDYDHEEHPTGVFMANRDSGRMPLLSMASVSLAPGNLVRIGKINGIEIYNQNGEIDHGRLHQIGDPLMQRALMSDTYLSRRHAEIYVTDVDSVIVRDLGSTNETWIEVDDAPDPVRRLSPKRSKGGHLRAIE